MRLIKSSFDQSVYVRLDASVKLRFVPELRQTASREGIVPKKKGRVLLTPSFQVLVYLPRRRFQPRPDWAQFQATASWNSKLPVSEGDRSRSYAIFG